METYKYYILSLTHKHVMGVISDDNGIFEIQELVLGKAFNEFSNCDQNVLVPNGEIRKENIKDFEEVFYDLDITKDYIDAICHLTGKKRVYVKAL